MWIIEVCYDSPAGLQISEGTGVCLTSAGLITCAHVVASEGGKGAAFSEIKCWQLGKASDKYNAKIARIDGHRDIAMLELFSDGDQQFSPVNSISLAPAAPAVKDEVSIYGFPSLQLGQKTPYVLSAKVAMILTSSGREQFAVDSLLRPGISGGPVVSSDGSVIGIAQKGVDQSESGHNIALCSTEIVKFAANN